MVNYATGIICTEQRDCSKKLMISCLRVAQLHQRKKVDWVPQMESKRKWKKSKDSVQRAMQIAENASMDQTYLILDMRGQ